jgi:hypothetical protein
MAIAKTLVTIDKRMDKTAEQYGRASSFGQYLLYLAKAIGASQFVIPAKNDHRSWNYADQDLRRRTLAEGASHVDWMIRQWKDREGEK